MSKIAIAVTLLCLVAGAAQAGESPSGLCPPGSSEMFNVNQPGCTFCFATTDCAPACVGAPQCFCPEGDAECCRDNPCCQGCSEPKPLRCDTSSCTCTPDTCCSTVCPNAAVAPASSGMGLGVLAAVLLVLGAGAVRFAMRR